MPSNRELIEQARTLGEKLGVPVETQGLGNQALVLLVDELRAKQGGAKTEPPPEAERDWTYSLKPHCYLNCSRGVLGPLDIVRPSDVSNGVEQLESMVASGTLIKR